VAMKSEILKISGKKGASEWSVRVVSSKTTGGQSKRRAVMKETWSKATCPKFVGKAAPAKNLNKYKVGFGTFSVPNREKEPVPVKASAISNGMKEAQKQIKSLVKEFADTLFQQYKITEIELTLAFSAKGAFLGIGVGGEASIKVKISPIEE
jgi:hypothetical protein